MEKEEELKEIIKALEDKNQDLECEVNDLEKQVDDIRRALER